MKSTFLNGDLHEEVFVTQPEDFLVKGYEENMYKLRKAFYGFKQVPRACYSLLNIIFIIILFKIDLKGAVNLLFIKK